MTSHRANSFPPGRRDTVPSPAGQDAAPEGGRGRKKTPSQVDSGFKKDRNAGKATAQAANTVGAQKKINPTINRFNLCQGMPPFRCHPREGARPVSRIAIRGFIGGIKQFEERVDQSESGARLAETLARRLLALPGGDKHMIEIEFIDQPDPLQRFCRFGTDPAMMIHPRTLSSLSRPDYDSGR
jgi:hypothetical protein